MGKPALVAPNQLQRQFQYDEPDQAWVTDITYIRTHEGWLYLAAVLDLHSRAVVGWSMGSRMQTSLVLDALTMAVWRRKPKNSVIIHSDQGSQFGSDEFNRWCKDNRLSPSMSRRGNCWDNAVAESFFSNLKSEKIRTGRPLALTLSPISSCVCRPRGIPVSATLSSLPRKACTPNQAHKGPE